MGDAPELKPCPFCGQSNTIQTSRLYLECLECGCYGPDAKKGQPRNDEYAPHRAWNTRADTITALEEENKRLREAMERAARYADGIRGAVETNQVADKDVRGVAILIRNNLRAALNGK